MNTQPEYRYNRLTWPEMNAAIAAQMLLILHHIDFPGTIHIEPETFIAFCLNITKSVAYHGFEKILLVNGHGSNGPLVDLIARKTVLATRSLCFATSYFAFLREAFQPIRQSEVV